MAPVAASGPDSPDPIRVLVVDNVALFRESVAALIDRQEDLAAVGQAANGLEAVELALELRPDVVLLDVEMPVMDGIEAARLILEQNSATRVLMLTVSDREDHLLAAVRLGVQGYLLKDLRPDQLFDMIRAAMRGETPVSPALVTRLMAELRACGQAASAASPPLPEEDLSHRELEVLQLVATGQSNKEIGRALSITEGTVKNHVHNALQKLGMENRIQAAAYVVRRGLGNRPSHPGEPLPSGTTRTRATVPSIPHRTD